MSSYVELLLESYKGRGLLIDANLLLLYFVGMSNPRLIGDARYKKLAKYTVADFDLLMRLRAAFPRELTTAHVLTEVSNLTGDLPEATRMACLEGFRTLIPELEEQMVASAVVAQRAEFPFLGLTDTVLASFADEFLIVTDDARMVSTLERSGLRALNFNHLRKHLFQ